MVSSAGVLSPGFTSSPPASVVASGTVADVSSVASVESVESVTSVGSVASVAFSVVSGSFSSVSTQPQLFPWVPQHVLLLHLPLAVPVLRLPRYQLQWVHNDE